MSQPATSLRSVTHGVSLYSLVILCLACFFAGRLLQHATLLPDFRSSPLQTHPSVNATRFATSQQLAHLSGGGEYVAEKEVDIQDTEDVDFLFPLQINNPTYPGPKELQQLLSVLGLKDRRLLLGIRESGEHVYHSIPFQLLSWQPRLQLLPNFLTMEQCQQLIDLSQADLQYHENDGDDVEGFALGPYSEDGFGIIASMSKRVAAFTQVPIENMESVRIFRYSTETKVGYPPNWQTDKRYLASVMVFLSEVDEGGDTVFPFEGIRGTRRQLENNDACSIPDAYRVPPRLGDALLVWRLNYRRELDQAAEHWACPPTKGTQWMAVARIYEVPDVDPDADPFHAPVS